MTTVGVCLFDGAEELDWAGPWEVFGMWASLHPDEATVVALAEGMGPITCAKGVRVLPDRTYDEASDLDLLIYPGGRGTKPQLDDDGLHQRLRRWTADGVLMASVCTGSLVFAAAGLLDGRPATTHWSALDKLGRLGTDIEVRPQERFVDAGDFVTSAGVSAGIDMALHLIARVASAERAVEVRRAIQYDPEPPV